MLCVFSLTSMDNITLGTVSYVRGRPRVSRYRKAREKHICSRARVG